MAAAIRAALRETPTVELRLDWLTSDAERSKFLGWLRHHRPRRATLLATCRRKGAGGRFAGDIDAQLYWLIQAREAGCQWCDIEVETLRELPGQSAREYAVPPRIMLSLHDFERTPELTRAVHLPLHGEVDTVKIAAHARTIADSVRLLRWAWRSKNCIAVPMGEVGLPGRILALREGSTLAYAPVAATTAPGQVSLHELKHLYRAHELSRRTGIFGVIGDPVGHSLSPLMHNSAFVSEKVNAVYLPFLVKDLRDFLAAVPEFDIRGFSVTIPHKQNILKYLKQCDPLAADIGAVNTVAVHRDGSLHGFNTGLRGRTSLVGKETRSCEKPRADFRCRWIGTRSRVCAGSRRCFGCCLRAARPRRTRTSSRGRRRGCSAARSADAIFRRCAQYHSGRNVSARRNFSVEPPRVTLSNCHGPDLPPRAHAIVETGRH